mgnify:FL=1
MVLTIIPAGLYSTAGAVSDEISTMSIDASQGLLEMPSVSISSTAVIRTAAAAKSQAAGSTIVKATASGLPEIDGDYTSAFYAGETPTNPMVVFTTDKALKAQPTITCTNANLTFTAADNGVLTDGVYTYSWIVSGSNVTVKQLDFEVGYTYEYVDANGKTITKTYTAYASSAVENVAQPGGIFAHRYRSWHITKHNCDRKEKVDYIARILGANTFGTFVDPANVGWERGYYDFNTSSFVKVDGVASGYAQNHYDDHSNEGTQNANTANDLNRPVTVAYLDRSIANLNNYNLRFSITDTFRNTSKYSEYGIKEFKIAAGGVEFDGNTPTNAASVTQLGVTDVAPIDTNAGGTITIGMNGAKYLDGMTTLDNGNQTKSYTFIVSFGATYKDVTRIRSAINLDLVTYDKSELRADLQDLYRAYTPTQLLAADSEIGNNPNSWFYSEGWSEYLAAFKNAEYILNDPDTDQNKIDAADAALKAAVAGLKVATADYTEANVVEAEVKALQSDLYTDESWSRVQTAMNNLKSGISIFNQTYLDSLVADVRYAISKLDKNPANYDEVDAMVKIYEGLNPEHYTAETWQVLRDTVESVNYNLKVDQQALVDAYARSIDAAIQGLQLAPADYTAVREQTKRYDEVLPNKDLYVELRWRAVAAAYNAIEWDKNWKQQEDVDDMATNLRNAIDRLTYKDASYTDLETEINASSGEKESWYTPETWAPFAEALAAAENAYSDYEDGNPLDITKQSEIDALKEALATARAGLVDADGDYTKVRNAIEKADALDQSKYTADSWQVLQNAIDSVEYNLLARDQEKIDGFADAILDAIKKLNEIGADYTAVRAIIKEWNDMDKSLYTEASILRVANEVNAVNWNLPLSQQATVDGYVTKIRTAMDLLEYKPADYSAVDVAMKQAQSCVDRQNAFAEARNGYSYYTKDSYDALVASMTYTKGLDIRYQNTVEGYAAAINAAIKGLKPNDADYSAVEEALKKIPADLEDEVYTDETAAEVIAAKLVIERGLLTDEQDKVDGYAKDLETAIAGLVYKPADYTKVTEALKKVPTDLTPYTKSSVTNLQNVINSVNYGLNIKSQTIVDGYADAILVAIEALEPDRADYTIVETAKKKAEEAIKDTNYTDESIQAVKDAINAVVYDLPSSEQARVNAFADAIDAAVAALTDKPLDLTSYNEAIKDVPESLDNFTDESVKLYKDALAAADNFKLIKNSIRNQTEFETLVSALDAAARGLKYKPADYTKVREAQTAADEKAKSGLYTDASVAGYNDIIASIDWAKTIDEQAEVNAYADAINSYVFEYKLADYTKLDAAIAAKEAEIAKGLYTDASVSAFRAVVAGFLRDRNITQQGVVDGYTDTVINYTFEYLPADYSKLNELVDYVNGLDSSLYENYDEIYNGYIFDYIYVTIPANGDYNITEQSKVDDMTATLQSYIDMLVLKNTKTPKFELKNGASYKKSGGVTYIKGLDTGLRENTLKSTYFEMENVNVTITKAVTGRYIGTGSTVTVTDLDGNVIGEYVILIYGDVNGDGTITARDINDIENQIMSVSSLTAAGILAANINGDRMVTAADGKLIENVISGSGVLNQSTGRVS